MEILQSEKEVLHDKAKARSGKPSGYAASNGIFYTLPQRWVGEKQVLPIRTLHLEGV